MNLEISPEELKTELASANPPALVDIRDDEELEISKFPEFVHVPLMVLHTKLSELALDGNYIVVCRNGADSERSAEFLRHSGFERVRFLKGGINNWAASVDPSLPQY
jgi:rhodanese-related sulfurtransferase